MKNLFILTLPALLLTIASTGPLQAAPNCGSGAKIYEYSGLIHQIGVHVGNDNETAYIVLPQVVGPTECKSNLLKYNFKQPSRSSDSFVQKLLTAALLGDKQVRIKIPLDGCLYEHPTICTVYLKR